MNETTDEHGSVLLTRKSFVFWKGFLCVLLGAHASCVRGVRNAEHAGSVRSQGRNLRVLRVSVSNISIGETRSTWWAQSSQIGHVFYHGRDGHATKPSWHAPLLNQSPGRRTAHSLFRVDFKSAIANPQSEIRNRQSEMRNPQSAIVSPSDSLPVGAAIPSGAPLASCAYPPYGICPSGRLP